MKIKDVVRAFLQITSIIFLLAFLPVFFILMAVCELVALVYKIYKFIKEYPQLA
jgi:pilus assembly protein TadC